MLQLFDLVKLPDEPWRGTFIVTEIFTNDLRGFRVSITNAVISTTVEIERIARVGGIEEGIAMALTSPIEWLRLRAKKWLEINRQLDEGLRIDTFVVNEMLRQEIKAELDEMQKSDSIATL